MEDSSPTKKRKRLSSIWQEFDATKEGVICKKCNTVYSSEVSTTTLRNHTNNKHFDVSIRYEHKMFDKKEVDRLLALYVCTSASPFRIVENKMFRTFIKHLNPDYVVPGRKRI